MTCAALVIAGGGTGPARGEDDEPPPPPINCLAGNSTVGTPPPEVLVTTCEFLTPTPFDAAAQGYTSTTDGTFVIETEQPDCDIAVPGTVDGNVTTKRLEVKGAGIKTVLYGINCRYRLTVLTDGTGTVLAGQTN